MLVRYISDGSFRNLADADALKAVHEGQAIPSYRVRLREDGLFSRSHLEAGTVVDFPGAEPFEGWPGPPPDDHGRFDVRAAVVPNQTGRTAEAANHSTITWTAGVPILLHSWLARELVIRGARYATPEEAAPLYAAG